MWVGRARNSVWVAWGWEMVFWVGAPICTCTPVGMSIVCVDWLGRLEVSVDVCLYVCLWAHRLCVCVCMRVHAHTYIHSACMHADV
jgi:hypothetical protein